MAKTGTAKKLGTTGKVLIGAGVVLLAFVSVRWYLRNKKKKECAKNGGTWNSKTNSCDLPNNNAKILKDAYDNLTFEVGKAIIKPTSFPYLDELITVIQDPEALTWSLEIQGHTDNKGGDAYNQKLSEDRANAVKKYLVDKGIKAERIIAKGFGLTKPIATNDTVEGRAKNRRVEFIIRKPDATAPTSDQAKKAWLEQQAKNITSITDKSRFEPFTVIPNYVEGSLSTRTIESSGASSDAKITPYFPKGVSLCWYSDSNLIGYRDTKKEDLKMYLENGNIVSKSPSVGNPLVWKYLGKWK
jgi:outer membrane protein OmpA-like peptidoglycan-associated protein